MEYRGFEIVADYDTEEQHVQGYFIYEGDTELAVMGTLMESKRFVDERLGEIGQ